MSNTNSNAVSPASQYPDNPQTNPKWLEDTLASLPTLPPAVATFVALLIFHRGRVVRHKVMYKHLWPHARKFKRYKLTQEAIRARAYLGDSAPFTLIKNVWNVGYKWGGDIEKIQK
jgi:DNA-binding winged helix-turn-helix (wHTH) protein